jgi:hypothetical protein
VARSYEELARQRGELPERSAPPAMLVFEAIGDDKVRVNCSSWEDAKVILAEEGFVGWRATERR